MTGSFSWWNRMLAVAAALAMAAALPTLAEAQGRKKKDEAAAEQQAPQPEYSKEFRKIAGKAQGYANDKKWAELLAMLPEFDALPAPSRDELKAIATWRLQATQGIGDQDAFAKAIEVFLQEGYTAPDQVGAMHRQLAAYYSSKQDREKTVYHFRQFVDATLDVEPDEFETLGRLYLQVDNYQEGARFLGEAIDLSVSRGETPKDLWYQLRDRCFIELKDDAARLANLEALVGYYPDKEYYSRIVAIYQNQSQDDRTVMLNAYRLAISDPRGGLATVGGYLNYADTALATGSPGEAARALERGMKEGIVPSVGTNQQTLQDAKAAVAQDRKSLPAEAAAAEKNAQGQVAVKVGLGFYSTGEFDRAAALTRTGIAKGGVARLDDANLQLGAALMELGRKDEARAAFQAAAAASAPGSHMARIAALWLKRIDRADPAPSGG
jgi:tetratricopeptide (TPR) repeat protein